MSADQPRQFLHLTGSQEDCLRVARSKLIQYTATLWISTASQVPEALPAKKAHSVLGQEFDAIVFDAFSGLEVNALAAVSGTLRGGGLFILISPTIEIWPNFPDPAYQRFLPYPYTVASVRGLFLKRLLRVLQEPAKTVELAPSLSSSQAKIVEQIIYSSTVLVLTADRGRGKSAALGLAANRLIAQGNKVLLTAPSRAAVESVFKHAELAPVFYAPDDLLLNRPKADVLLVDEAAAIPLNLLLSLVKAYPRVVFATTLHGYEGSGRGFVLRFQQALNELVPKWQGLRLEQPMRWPQNDPLETLMYRLLLLDVEAAEVQFNPKISVEYKLLPQEQLLVDEALLQQVFGLLVAAHYQTRPSDLQQILDAPNLSIHILEQNQQILAVALLSREGGFDAELSAAIYAGQRRPHGHLVPQTLTFHAKIVGAAELSCERIMRIAVHPSLQGQGLGRRLVQALKTYASRQKVDYLAVSYALSPELLRFWQDAGFVLARIGYRKDTASASRSAVQIHALSTAGEALVERILMHSPVDPTRISSD
ncbi:GNAT family N-acetyltransferase [uncultured Thiothrix sp.]|uniref:tRNA(Met) cytidine acetyltransferase TmcA n=1 Tax=uncultured Thiothrix sp. TaxID=223185 RepID=UPI0026399E88|nr:GNAT family N-acetyltransferase [uncultured Thiothrix sp.]HMT92609.1 GNAT family N-acetyltransferase [Thiolinea sp.]